MTAQQFRYVLLALIILVIAGGGAIGYFGLQRLHARVAKAQKVKIDAQIAGNARDYAIHAREELQEKANRQLAEYLGKVIPEPSYRYQFIADVNQYAKVTGVPLEAIEYADPESTEAPSVADAVAIPVRLQMGDDIPYEHFIAFVTKLENNLQHIQVLSIQMTPNPENRSALQSASLTIALYVEPKDG